MRFVVVAIAARRSPAVPARSRATRSAATTATAAAAAAARCAGRVLRRQRLRRRRARSAAIARRTRCRSTIRRSARAATSIARRRRAAARCEAACDVGHVRARVLAGRVRRRACADGFATDANGCLTCACAAAGAGRVRRRRRLRARREPTAAAARRRRRHRGAGDARSPRTRRQLDVPCESRRAPASIPARPISPPRCVQGDCALVVRGAARERVRPPGSAGVPDGEACTVNANDQATMHGVGVCQPAP